MKFRRSSMFAFGVLSVFFASVVSQAQTPGPASPVEKQQEPTKAPAPGGKVIFSRSIEENSETESEAGPAATNQRLAPAPTAEDAERQAVTYTAFDMDVRLRPESHALAVRALVTVRNDSKTPLAHIPLQISSSLNWESVRIAGKNVTFPVAILNSDSDHTGQLHEATVTLAQPLVPGADLQLDVTYSGTITANARRLLALGTPEAAALHSDWDQVDAAFTGLRGFGNVVWYPVSTVPVILGDGARLFDEIGEHKLRLAGASFRLRLTVEFSAGKAPSVALINGHPAALSITNPTTGVGEISGIATAEQDGAILGFEAPSLFLASRKEHPGPNLTAWTLSDNEVAVESWINAANDVTPFLQGWLGKQPRAQLTLLDLPDPQDAPFETGALLATSLHEAPADQLDGVLAHALTHAWMQSPRAWLSEGVAHFMGTLWTEKQQGRDKALTALEAGRQALALAEPPSPGDSPGQPLAQAISPVYYRTKATYVLWMLRDIAGDPTLSAALRAYDPTQDVARPQSKEAGTGSFELLVEQAGTRRDLAWFFSDWVSADKGLPDLSVDSVFPTPEEAGNWLVAVNIANSGYATAEVPVTVNTPLTSVTQRVRVPARGKVVQRIMIQGKPTSVQVNDGTVPESQASVHITNLESVQNSPSAPAPAKPPQP
jgi:hypothetical protein